MSTQMNARQTIYAVGAANFGSHRPLPRSVSCFPPFSCFLGPNHLAMKPQRQYLVSPVSPHSHRPSLRCYSVPSSNPSGNITGAVPDLVLSPPSGGADILVFGAVHGDTDGRDAAEFIFKHRPHTVVVETGITTAHGSATGNVATMEECLMVSSYGGVDGRTRAVAHIGSQLRGLPDPLGTQLWRDVSNSPMFFSEHLVYAAAFAVEAKLVFGDRPKMLTYQKMLYEPTVVDLDIGFGQQSALNYHDLVVHRRPPARDPASVGVTERIMFLERDAVLLESLYKASLDAGQGNTVVGVVGLSHLTGMQTMWKNEEWRELAQGANKAPTSSGENETPEQFGVRRALFDGFIRLTCRSDVIDDIFDTLGAPPPAAMEAYELTHELYGSSRMLMACLDRDQLEEVCQGWRCDMWDVLAPLRAVRPCNGGPGYDTDLVLQLRTLNYEIN